MYQISSTKCSVADISNESYGQQLSKVKMLCIDITGPTTHEKFTRMYITMIHRDKASRVRLLSWILHFSRSLRSNKAEPRMKKKSLTYYSLILPTPPDRSLTLIRKVTGTGDNSLGLPHIIRMDVIVHVVVHLSVTLIYVLDWFTCLE